MHWLAIGLEVSTHLPRAESLEEEEERKAPDHGGADDAEQGDQLDSLSTAKLGKHGCQQGHCPPQGSTTEPKSHAGVLTHYPP